MAFPTNAVLDNFNTTALQNLTARAGWSTSVMPSGTGTFTTNATPTAATKAVAAGNAWGTSWTDMEAYCTLTAFTPASDEFLLCARITNATATPTYYAVDFAFGGATEFQIVKVVAGTRTAIGALQAITFAAGDSVGIDVIGTQVRSYYKVGAGAWTLKDTVTDSSITGSGPIGFRHTLSATCTVDDFGGGALVAPPNPRNLHVVRRTWAGR